MSLVLAEYGRTDAVDYVNNWREADAEWLQARSIIRYATTASRNTALGGSPAAGITVYNAETDSLELRGASAWKKLTPLPQNLLVPLDDATGVTLAHSG